MKCCCSLNLDSSQNRQQKRVCHYQICLLKLFVILSTAYPWTARALILMWGPATRKISTPSAHARQHNKEPGLTSARPRRRTSSASSPLILFRSYDKLVLFRQFAWRASSPRIPSVFSLTSRTNVGRRGPWGTPNTSSGCRRPPRAKRRPSAASPAGNGQRRASDSPARRSAKENSIREDSQQVRQIFACVIWVPQAGPFISYLIFVRRLQQETLHILS